MTCDFCENKAKYAFTDGERTCAACLSLYPTESRELKLMIVALKNKLKPFEQAANKMKEFNTDKPPIVHEKHWLNLISKEE